MDDRIEISQDLVLQASIHFWVDRTDWNAMTDDQRRELIAEKVESAAIRCDNDCIEVDGSVTMSAGIRVPAARDVNLSEISIYDPDE